MKGQGSKAIWIKAVLAQYEGRLVRYAHRKVPLAQAQECVQETFLKLWKEEPPPANDRLAPWLFTVCRNQLLDVLRKESRMSPLKNNTAAQLPSEEAGPSEVLETKQNLNIVTRSIGELPPHLQEIVRLKFQEGLSYKEMSEVTGHSVAYVGVLLHQAMLLLRVRLATNAAADSQKGEPHGY